MTALWGQVRHRVVIGGRVMDEKAKRAVSGAVVTLTAVPEEFKVRCAMSRDAANQSGSKQLRQLDETSTSATGYYYFFDLPKGSYELRVTGVGRTPPVGTGKATVSLDKNGAVVMTMVDLVLKYPR